MGWQSITLKIFLHSNSKTQNAATLDILWCVAFLLIYFWLDLKIGDWFGLNFQNLSWYIAVTCFLSACFERTRVVVLISGVLVVTCDQFGGHELGWVYWMEQSNRLHGFCVVQLYCPRTFTLKPTRNRRRRSQRKHIAIYFEANCILMTSISLGTLFKTNPTHLWLLLHTYSLF